MRWTSIYSRGVEVLVLLVASCYRTGILEAPAVWATWFLCRFNLGKRIYFGTRRSSLLHIVFSEGTKKLLAQTSRESKVFLCLLSINNSEFVACAKLIIKERKRRKVK